VIPELQPEIPEAPDLQLVELHPTAQKSKSEAANRGELLALLRGIKWSLLQGMSLFSGKLLRGLVVPKLLPPDQLALSASLNVIQLYSQHCDLGVTYRMGKRLPYIRAQGGEAAFREAASKAASWVVGMSSLVGALVFAFSFLYTGSASFFYRPALRLFAIFIVLGKFREFMVTTLVSREQFRKVTTVTATVDAASLVATICIVPWAGPIGMVWALLFSEIVGLSCAVLYGRPSFSIPRIRDMIPMVREGLQLLVINILDAVLLSVDQFFLLHYYSRSYYGYYSLGLFVASSSLYVSGAFLTCLQPRLMTLEGQNRREDVRKVVDSVLLIYSCLAGVLVALIIPAMTLFVTWYLPKYRPGLPIYVLMAAMCIVRGPAILLRPMFFAMNAEMLLVRAQIASLAVIIAANIAILKFFPSPVMVAAGSVAAHAIGTSIIFWLHDRRKSGAQKFRKYVPSFVGIVGVAALFLAQLRASAGHGTSIGITMAGFAAYLAVMVFVSWTCVRTLPGLQLGNRVEN
jgi:O-antigen/teichoic acid export membrane protein